jgi:hypothetical protein
VCISWQFATLLFLATTWQSGLFFWFTVLASFIVLLFILGNLEKLPSRMRSECRVIILHAFLRCLLLAPLLFFAANELSYFLSRWGYQALTPFCVFVLLTLSVVVRSIIQKVQNLPGSFYMGLCVLLGNVLIIEYTSTIQYGHYDLFHFGERLLPLQQWSSYGLLPFKDYLPTHGLFDAFPHIIYQQINNSSPFEALVWGNGYFMGWFMRAIAISIFYAFISRLIEPVSAFFLLWLLPSYHLIDPYYSFLLLPAIHVLNLQQTKAINRWWFLQWAFTVLIMLWRLDFGVVLIAGNFALMVLASWYLKSSAHILRGGLVGAGVIFLAVVVFILISGGYQGVESLLAIKAYMASQIIVTSYAEVYKEINFSSLMQLVLLPGSIALVLAYSFSRLVRRTASYSLFTVDLLIIFLGVATLIMSMRSLHRHTLLEGGFKNYLFLLVMFLSVLRFWLQRGGFALAPVLALFVMVSFLVVPKGDKPVWRSVFHLTPQWEYPFALTGKQAPAWEVNPVRMVDKVNKYDGFIEFMASSLKKGESFYDFANAPLLYVLADVEVPVYVTETLFQSSDTLQKKTVAELASWHRQDRLPFVVFRQNNIWDRLDNVDNALRSYLIAEFIYGAYKPCVKVDHFDIWIDKRIASADDCQAGLNSVYSLGVRLQKKIVPLREDYLHQYMEFHYVPYLWASFDKAIDNIREIRTAHVYQLDQQHWSLEIVDGFACKGQPCYLDLEIDSKSTQQVRIAFLSEDQAELTVLEGVNRYRIRMSSLWHWYRSDAFDSMELHADSPFQLLRGTVSVLSGEKVSGLAVSGGK